MASVVIAGDTSGTVTLAAPAVAGTTTLTLPTANGTILTTGSSGQSIPSAALPTGSVLQVVNASYATETQNNTNTYADTGLTASITPLYSTSKILVLVNQAGLEKITSDTYLRLQLLRGASQIALIENEASGNGGSALISVGAASMCYLDSPATTSSTTYKTQFLSTANTNGVRVQAGSARSTITLMEIAA